MRAERNPRGSYYGMPMLNPPVWEEREIAGYLFLGGLAGAGSLLAVAGQLTRAPKLTGRMRVVASGSVTLSLGALIYDLGRPERFLNMLRVFKPTSPMNVGTWLLSAYAPLSFAASATSLTRRLRRTGNLAGVGAGALGSLVATYTAALIADTAVPAWHEGHRELPFLFAASAASAAGGLGLTLAPRAENSPAWRMALIGGTGELLAEELLQRRLGPTARALQSQPAHMRLQAAKALTVGGVAMAALAGRRRRSAAIVAGVALAAASALTRFGLFAAGMESAENPGYVVESQKH